MMKPISCQILSIEIDPSIAVYLRVKEPLANIEIRASAIRRCPAIRRLNRCDDTSAGGDVHDPVCSGSSSLDDHLRTFLLRSLMRFKTFRSHYTRFKIPFI
jgi:hypothetical protein